MLLLGVFLFAGLFVALTYGIEFILPPFGKLFYTDFMDILQSLALTLSFKTNIPEKYCLIFTVFIISIIPFLITFFFNKSLKKRRKDRYKYKL